MIIKTKRLKEIINKYNYLLNKYNEVLIWESAFECFECSDKNIILEFENGVILRICKCKVEFKERLINNDNN